LLQALIMDVCMGFIHIPAGIWLNIGLDPFWHTCVVAGKSYRAVHALLLDQWHRSLSEIQEPFFAFPLCSSPKLHWISGFILLVSLFVHADNWLAAW